MLPLPTEATIGAMNVSTDRCHPFHTYNDHNRFRQTGFTQQNIIINTGQGRQWRMGDVTRCVLSANCAFCCVFESFQGCSCVRTCNYACVCFHKVTYVWFSLLETCYWTCYCRRHDSDFIWSGGFLLTTVLFTTVFSTTVIFYQGNYCVNWYWLTLRLWGVVCLCTGALPTYLHFTV